jgi:hypothetical protein
VGEGRNAFAVTVKPEPHKLHENFVKVSFEDLYLISQFSKSF